MNNFYSEISKYPINKIISIDETAIRPVIMNEYSRCELGKRCIFKTNDTFMFRKYTLLVAISNSKCIGWTTFEKGAMNKERLVEFMKEYIFRKYKDHLIVMDNLRYVLSEIRRAVSLLTITSVILINVTRKETHTMTTVYDHFRRL